ncbi:hypothetical protein AB6A40_009974 [Gnathostoma spinigerum]|uniref:Uncharacterized protein n=1 Tax=Gnathostoma spinigerum TaxID=75299 RepID=A0ABD6F2H8_9BILA
MDGEAVEVGRVVDTSCGLRNKDNTLVLYRDSDEEAGWCCGICGDSTHYCDRCATMGFEELDGRIRDIQKG